ncbi:hypothetical protein [Paenibacillus polymyxa]|uniref:hypothetical protein n=1 Tax=Paenibacillus polymyxa TaxID=1406 RepID=UPI0025B693BD|nr:hypothetical protein [Paenibacillus polymyxa]MDN4106120.1 hypothetical protein [Paenibacillus polymyxa]
MANTPRSKKKITRNITLLNTDVTEDVAELAGMVITGIFASIVEYVTETAHAKVVVNTDFSLGLWQRSE